MFIASLTSNPEGMSLQTALRQSGDYKGRTVAYGIASTAQKHNVDIEGMGSVGLIIGATIGQWINDSGVDPAKFTGPILSPGYGWQGAETRDLKTVFKGTKGNVLVTVSRLVRIFPVWPRLRNPWRSIFAKRSSRPRTKSMMRFWMMKKTSKSSSICQQ